MESLEVGEGERGRRPGPHGMGSDGIGALMIAILAPCKGLPRGVRGSKIGIDGERACGLAPLRYRVKRRGRVNGRRVGENAVEREAAVGAVEHFGGGA